MYVVLRVPSSCGLVVARSLWWLKFLKCDIFCLTLSGIKRKSSVLCPLSEHAEQALL